VSGGNVVVIPETIKTEKGDYQCLAPVIPKPLKIMRPLQKLITEPLSFTKRVSMKLPSQNPRTPSAAAGPLKRPPMTLTRRVPFR
jgi:hypothetical protein